MAKKKKRHNSQISTLTANDSIAHFVYLCNIFVLLQCAL